VKTMENLLEIVKLAVKEAEKAGAKEAEAYASWNKSVNVEISQGQIAKSSITVDQGIGIRAIIDKRIGFAYTNSFNEKIVKETALKAVESAKANKPDEDWKELPSPKPLPTVGEVFDNRIVEMNVEDVVKIALRMLDAATSYDKRVIPFMGSSSTIHVKEAIANSQGIEGFDEGTAIVSHLATIARDPPHVSPWCAEFDANRILKIDPEWVGKEAARLAIESLKGEKVEKGEYPVIFMQDALFSLWMYTLIPAVRSDYIQRDRSALKGKIDQQVASELLTILDDGTYKGGLKTSKFDGEGVPRQKTPIIEKGILKGYLYNNYTAKKENKESTGNADRSESYGVVRSSYALTPTVAPSNFFVKPGTISSDEMISEIKEGFLVKDVQGAHSSNPESGELSVVATPCWKIENGEIAYAAKGVMIAGNMYNMIKNVTAVANNIRKYDYLITPWIRIDNVKIVTK